MRLRPAVSADAQAVGTLEEALFGPDAWSETAVLSELEGPGRHALVAMEAEDVIGYAVALRSGDLVDLQRIGVRADRRRRGIARVLLDEAVEHASTQGAHRMLLEVSDHNTAALAFYATVGFVEIDRRRGYYRDGTDAVVMRHSLGRAACGGRG